MDYKIFGKKTGLPVSDFALGTGNFGTAWGYGAEAKEAERMLSIYADRGGNLIDTADTYQAGESEVILGKAMASRRNDLVIASKYTRGVGQVTAPAALGNNRKSMVQAVEASLKRLNTDRLDIYFVHQDDFFTPMEEIVRGLDDLVRAGKVVYGGISNFAAWRVAAGATLADLRGWSSISAIEVEYSLLQRTTERDLLPMAEAYGLGVMAWSPLAGGLLTGKYRKGESGRATVIKGSIPYEGAAVSDAVLDELFAIAEITASEPGHVALAWLKAKGVIPVLGPRSCEQLENNLKAAALNLTKEQIGRLDSASSISLGFPHDYNMSHDNRMALTGGNLERIEKPKTIVL